MPARSPLHHMGYAAIRLPALPVRDWINHTRSSSEGPPAQAWQRRADSARKLFQRPAIAEAIYLASPGFHERLTGWHWNLRSADDHKMLASFERYLNRMCQRCTPFGTFATVSYARLQDGAGWPLDDAGQAPLERAARIDGEALDALCEKLNAVPDRASHYTANASLYAVGDSWRYLDWSTEPGKDRVYELAQIDRHPVIDAVIRETGGRLLAIDALESCLAALAQAEDIDLGSLVADLVDARVLVPAISLDPLNEDPAAALAARLAAHRTHGAIGRRLQSLIHALRAVRPGEAVEHYRQVGAQIRELAGTAPGCPVIQVDAVRRHGALALDAGPVEEAVAAIDYLADRFSVRNSPLDSWADAFGKRYGEGFIPLMEALDDETGIGYGQGTAAGELPARLGIRRPARQQRPAPPSPLEQYLLTLVQRDPSLLSAREIVLSREDLDGLPLTREGWDPPGTHVVLRFAPVRSGGGPHGHTTVLGAINPGGAVQAISRFCHADAHLHDACRDYARQVESETCGHMVHAEISYLPQGRSANVLTRPPIWTYRINIVEPAIEPGEGDLPLSDLYVRVNGKDVQLWSRRLGKRVMPHLTSAHNPLQRRNLAVYKFLCAVQGHSMRLPVLQWGGVFNGFEYRPRLRFDKLVLSPARWHIPAASLAALRSMPEAGQDGALRALLSGRRVPRRVELEELDNTLMLDLDDAVDREQLLRQARKGRDIDLCEVLDEFDDAGLVDGKPAWRNEVLVPLRRPIAAPAAPPPPIMFERDLPAVPAAQALYVKLYCGHERLDARVLPAVVDWVGAQRDAGTVARWFFIRYGDPDWHLRLRVFPHAGQHAGLLAQLVAFAQQLQGAALVSRFELTAYERELMRYGGPAHIGNNEWLFCIDSELAAAILHGNVFSKEEPERWMIACVAIDALLADFGLGMKDRQDLMTGLAARFKREFAVKGEQLAALGDTYRKHSRPLMAALQRGSQMPLWSRELWVLLDQAAPGRREVARAIITAGQPTPYELDMVASQVHMLCNRLFRSHAREYEVLAYDYLARAYRSLAAMPAGRSR